jgi:hypothetical protein
MTVNVGTFSMDALLAARFPLTNQGSYTYDNVAAAIRAEITAYNAVMNDMLGDLCELTTERVMVYGSGLAGDMIEVDEYGRAPSQNSLPGSQVAFPLKKYQFATGWSQDFLNSATVADIAIKAQGAMSAHKRRVALEIQKAFFKAANYTQLDRFRDNLSLSVKRMLNGDGDAIPVGPNGETFNVTTHTHYLPAAGAAPTLAEYTAIIDHVIEHGHGGGVVLAINAAQESSFRTTAGTSFQGFVDSRVTMGANSDMANGALDVTRLDNRAIGIFHGAVVWTKSWVPSGFTAAYDPTDPRKPLAFRQQVSSSLQGLRPAAQFNSYPLHAEYMESYFGIAANTRTNGALMDNDAGGGAYTDPAI